MANFFKSLFKGKNKEEENGKDKSEQKNFDILKYDGLRAQRIGRADYAMKCFQGALEIEEDFETMGYLTQLYIQKDELEEAATLLKRMIELEPHMVNSYLTLANVYFVEENYPEMKAIVESAIEQDKENATAHFLLAKACDKLNEEINAIAHLTTAISLQEDVYAEALLLRAEILIGMRQYTEAMKDIEVILGVNPDEEAALLLYGKIKEESNEVEEAESIYRKITDLNPFSEKAYISLGQLYIAQKKMDEAIKLFDEAIELNPNSAQAYHERGRAKLLNGDKEGSVDDMKKAMELNPKNAEAINGEFNNGAKEPQNSLGLPF